MALTSLMRPRRRGLRRRGEMFHPLEREMERLFDDFWLRSFAESPGWTEAYLPPVNVREEDNQVVVSAELPGMEDKDIEVTVQKDTVRISGEKKEEAETREGDFYRMESSHGRFDRLIDLPAEVDEDKAQAEFKNGVLHIRLPRSAESKTKIKKIPVKGG